MRPLCVLMLTAITLWAVPLGTAAAEETKELPGLGAKWTVPDGFAFQEPTPQQKADNYHAVVVNNSIPAQLYLVSETLRDRTLDDIQKDAIGVMRGGLFKEVKGIRKKQALFAGISGFLVMAQGTVEGDHEAYAWAYGAQRKGRFYLLLTVVYYGNQKTAWRELDEAKRGFRVLAEQREDDKRTGPWPDLEEGEGEDEAEDVTPEKPRDLWTEKAPKLDKESRTVTFPSHNLKWKVPEGSPFGIADVTQDEAQPNQRVIHFAGKVGDAAADVRLKVEQRKSTINGPQLVNEPMFMNLVATMLAERLPGRGELDQDMKIAGQPAGYLMLRGRNEEGNYRAVAYWVFTHGMEAYLIELIVGGESGCEKVVIPEVEKLMEGMTLISEIEPVPGPLAGAVPALYEDRGTFQGKAGVLTADKVQVQKPEFMAKLEPQVEGIAFAAEGWNEDRSAYLYVDIAVFEQSELSKNSVTFEEMAQDRADVWLDKAGDEASTGKGKKPWGKGKWARAKGIGWEFTGELGGHPFKEYGYILRHKLNAYVVRIQLGGEGAEKKLKKELKALQKGWKWLK